MANIYRPDGNPFPNHLEDDNDSLDIGPLDLDGHEDHNHEVIAIHGSELPEEVQQALARALGDMLGRDGESLAAKLTAITERDDPNPLTGEEWHDLRVTLNGTAYMLLQGVMHIDASQDDNDPHRTLTRDEATEGLTRAIERLQERFRALTYTAPKAPSEDD